MTPEYVLNMARQAMQVAMMIGAPMLLVSLIVGLLVAVFQAATQLNEQTLSFIPKLLAVAATMILAGPWVLGVIVDYTRDVLTNIPNYVN
ncbi:MULTISPECIES: flagellar biosynthesis protein FliQ [Ralstonia solanacearum species complex]|uniref:Flagellar biosynthetic protein FliQ n=4 Tax=Ralstonia solanacearum species complex TaxID=3116862 RepID=A0A0K1ZGA5_RALSL|nr:MULTISPECIES: flagellar biosynthesis protein FliQ [Ralstonia]AKZ25054.1 flagellar biosynthetic protein FliQ [Ralstonia solanacearum]APC66109.1 flagellar biosynthetic protein FliQ [Ralstonia solanacearum OE1-1]APF88919.1 EscS/YscS/HrcS family type III secretion system export apparatus protein [Ralstonia solanacearum FJAT-1458]ARS58211.1 EscS/YscS/HrcS family type III secretion system export apparatus protein [Ralstonia solanacearum FJAT-91]ESS49720.1 flagellar biosynthesis protein FliQ [Rals